MVSKLMLAAVLLTGPMQSAKTSTGIPIDSQWKQSIYDFAKANVVHPSWGLAHSERDYQVTTELAKVEGISVDEDVLFAAAFLHDIGGITPFDKEGVDHAVRSVEVIEPLLQKWGFPMEKWPAVKEMILGHTYYGPAPTSREALAFRDADILDFLGNIGVARILAITEEPGRASTTLGPTVGILNDFGKTMAQKCSLNACRDIASRRGDELMQFLKLLKAESFNGLAL